MTKPAPRLMACGDAALRVDCGNISSVEVHRRVHALDAALSALWLEGVIEIVPTDRALCIHFHPIALPIARLERKVQALVDCPEAPFAPARRWQVPASGDRQHGRRKQC